MPVQENIKKKANKYFFVKVAVNVFLMIFGAVLIALFLTKMQHDTALFKQRENNVKALTDAVAILEMNDNDAQELSDVFHDGNQDMLDDLSALFSSGLFESLTNADNKTRSEVFLDMVNRSGVNYLFIMSSDGTVAISPYEELFGRNLVELGILTQNNLTLLNNGTKKSNGSITPALEDNDYGYFYFYSMPYTFRGITYTLVLGANAEALDVQIESLKDISIVLSRASVGNEGFMFAVNTTDSTFLYYDNNGEILTGQNALEAGLSKEALKDGYSGIETINGVKYYCVSKNYGRSTVICAVADTDNIYESDKYVIFWSVTGFVLVMILCLAYAVIVRNDFVRREVETEKKIKRTKKGNVIIFDVSIFKKVFPLMMAGVLLIFGISFYTQTLLEISESLEQSELALDEITVRYQESLNNRDTIRNYYDNRFLAKAKLISYLIEEDPSVLNEKSDKYHSYYDENGIKHFILDDEGNLLKSISSSERLKELCLNNDIESIYIYDEDGHTIATSTSNWFFTVSHDPESQSYAFLDIIDGKREEYVQETMVNDIGERGQYIGVAFTYFTRKDENGDTEYVSRFIYDDPTKDNSDVTAHRAMLQIGLQGELTDRILSSTDVGYVLSTNLLSSGFIVLFDSSEDHICLYSPFEARIGMKALDMGLSSTAFTGSDYYGFTRVNGVSYFQFFRYGDGYFIATALPRSEMYQSRSVIALITSVASLLLILILSLTITLTTEEEEMLYASMSESAEANTFDNTIFNIILPSGNTVSTVKAAARWDNRSIPWREKSPEQKLLAMVSFIIGLMVFYVVLAVLGANTFFKEGSIIQYILSGNWDRGVNIFAFSGSALVIIFVAIAEAILRLPVRLITSLLGARGETVGHLFLSIVKYGGAIAAIFYCLFLFGVDSTSLLASAGVLSLVIGLGAQSLIKDIIAGIFIVFEGEFRVGDIVTIGTFRGTVMDIGLRTTKIEGADGNIKIFNNSEITGVLNMTKEASLAFINVSIEYGQDIDYVEAVLNRELPRLIEKNAKLIDPPKYVGITKLGESGVELGIMTRCNEADIKGVIRFLNREVLKIFYDNDINVPFPNVTVSNLDTSKRKTMKDFVHTPEIGGEEFGEVDPG